MCSLISGVFLGSIYWAVCFSKPHWIRAGIFGSHDPIFPTWSVLGHEFSCSFRQRLQYSHFSGPGRPNSVGTYHTHILRKLWLLLLFWKVPIRLPSGPFSACEAGFEAFLEMGTSEGKVPQSSVREQRNLAASFGSHKKTAVIDQHKSSHKEIWLNWQLCALPKNWKNVLQIQWDPKKVVHNNQNT